MAMILTLSVLFSVTVPTLVSADYEVGLKLSKIPEVMPIKASDFTATYFDGSIEGSTADNKSSHSIILLGGCSAEIGNVYVADGDFPGFYCSIFSDQASIFYPEDGTFGKLPSMPQARTRHTAAVVDGKVYVVGGRDKNDGIVKDVIVFDPETQKWSTFITLADDYAASDHGSVVRKGKIYVFGGYDEFFSVVKTKAFSIDVRNDGNIENHTPMLTKRGDVAAVYYNHGKIDAAYIIGGFNDDNNFCAPLTTVERYNFASDSWTESSSDQIYLGSARGDKAAVVMDRKILAIGGEDKHEDFCESPDNLDPFTHSVAVDEIEVLDPLAKNPTWIYMSDLPEIRFRASAAVDVKNNALYLFGGQKAYDKTCDCYKTADDIFTYQGTQSSGLSITTVVLIPVFVMVWLMGGAFVIWRRRRGGIAKDIEKQFADVTLS